MNPYSPIDQALYFTEQRTITDTDMGIQYVVGGPHESGDEDDSQPRKSASEKFADFMGTPLMKGLLIGAAVFTIIILLLVFGTKK